MATLNTLKAQFEAKLSKLGVQAELTFITDHTLSLACDTRDMLAKARDVMAQIPALTFDCEDHDDECGSFAYYRF